MAVYKYKGRNAQGEVENGMLEAASEAGVATQLIKQGITPVSIELTRSKGSIWKLELIPRKVGVEDLIAFCRQMYSLLKAGVSIISAVRHVQDTTRSEPLKIALSSVTTDLNAGTSFCDALRKFPKIFSLVFVSVMDAGENSGQLDEAFNQVSTYLKLEAETRKRVKSATRYPMVIIGILVIAFFIVNLFVIPAFAELYAQFQGELPWITRAMVVTSNFIINYWFIILILVIAIFLGIRYFVRSKSGGYLWDRYKLKLPVFGSIINRALLGRFARTFSMMLTSGVSVVDAINLVARTMGNSYLESRLYMMAEGVEEGMTLTKMAIKTELFTPLVIQMFSVGEESGTVDSLLFEVAEYYEREVDYDLNRLSDLIEPILLVIMGVLVLIFALGVFLPIWDMVGFVQQ